LGGNAVLTLFPELQSSYGIEESVLLAVSLFMLPFAVGQIFTGALARKYNYQKTMVLGYLIYAGGCMLSGFAPDYSIFLISRVVQGIGYALVSPVTVAILGTLTVPETRGRYMGLLNAAIGGGIFLGPLIAGLLAPFNWRMTFYILGIISVLVSYIFWLTFKNMQFQRQALSSGEILSELKSVFSSTKVIFLCAAGFITFFSFMGVITLSSNEFEKSYLGFNAYERGIIIASSGVAQILLALPGGLIMDKFGRARTAYLGFGSAVLFSILFPFASTFIHFILLFAALGFSAVLIWAVLVTLSVELLPDRKIYVSSAFQSLRFFGFAAAPVVLGLVFSLSGIDMVYLICGVAFSTGIIFTYLLSKNADLIKTADS
jgi:DHA1 family multidrug resistance protein-like MFS transporter